MNIRVIVVDSNNTKRNAIVRAIKAHEQIKVISDLRSGKDGLVQVKRLLPKIIVIGDQLSDMSGYAFVMELMKLHHVAVLIITDENEEVIVDFPKALDFGIVDMMGISMSGDEINHPSLIQHRINILNKLNISRFTLQIESILKYTKTKIQRQDKGNELTKNQSKIDIIRDRLSTKNLQKSRSKVLPFQPDKSNKKVIVIGASTGGPRMLTYIVSQFPPNFPPVIIVQHMPRGFVHGFAERMDDNARMKVKMGQNNEYLKKGTVYIAPGGFHLELENRSGIVKIKITDGPKVNYVKPSVDVTLFSAVRCFGSGVISVILTGMGSDGHEGSRIVKQQKGTVFALSEEDSVIYGMNKAVIDAGLATEILGMDEFARAIGIALRKRI